MIDVAIIGAGPTGLMLGCELALAGVGVEILERRDGPVEYSKALTLHPRTVELAAMRGMADRFLERGRPLPTGHYGLLDTRLDFSKLESSHPYTLFIPQAVTEALLAARAAELGVRIHRGRRVESLAQDASGVTLGGTSGEGSFSVEARYVVGADGARSAVRTLAGIDFPGSPGRVSMVLGDVQMDDPPDTPMTARFSGDGAMLLVNLGSFHRIVLIDPLRADIPVREPLTLEELAESSRRVCGSDFGMRDPLWLSRFGDETRLAAHYRHGRVFLAGDAAHIHLPAGGQGLNVGVQDAFNLGWKLAAVLKDELPEALLDSYEAERRPVGAALIENTYSQSALMWGLSPDRLALRRTMNDLVSHPEINRRLAAHLAAFDIVYPAPPLEPPLNGNLEMVSALAGIRLPDFDLSGPAQTNGSLYAALQRGKWLLLHRHELGFPPIANSWSAFTETKATILPSAAPDLSACDALLVRPDGHVGWAWRQPRERHDTNDRV